MKFLQLLKANQAIDSCTLYMYLLLEDFYIQGSSKTLAREHLTLHTNDFKVFVSIYTWEWQNWKELQRFYI